MWTEERPAVRSSRSRGGGLRHVVRSRIAEYPSLYLPFARLKYPGPSPEVVGSQTELVIDGYTRSATTFAVYAFQLAQDRPVRVAHHLHAPAQLMVAAKKNIPAVLLIRMPRDAILSQLTREPNVALPNAMIAYARFYSRLRPYRSKLVVGDFEEVTKNFGAVIRRVNQRFGTSFREFETTDENVRQCLELARERSTTIPGRSRMLLEFESGLITGDELRVALDRISRRPNQIGSEDAWIPSLQRNRMKEDLREQWLDPSLAHLRARAELVYREFVQDVVE